eukprot:scaffold391948_cov43-Prasinocladus_malaysianus.AAC.1
MEVAALQTCQSQVLTGSSFLIIFDTSKKALVVPTRHTPDEMKVLGDTIQAEAQRAQTTEMVAVKRSLGHNTN